MASTREIFLADPFAALGVAEDANDAAIKARYLELVREFPPDREPERFQSYRRAFEAIKDARTRAELRLLHTTDAALIRLKRHCLEAGEGTRQGGASGSVSSLLAEALTKLPLE